MKCRFSELPDQRGRLAEQFLHELDEHGHGESTLAQTPQGLAYVWGLASSGVRL